VIVWGDSHAFWANQLYDRAGKVRVALELGASAGFQLGAVFMVQNKAVLFCDQLRKGYIRLTLTPEAAQGEMISVPIDAKPYAAEVLASWKLRPTPGVGVGSVKRV